MDAQKADLDGDGKPDILVEDLPMFVPGEPVQFHMKLVNPNLGDKFTLKTTLNGKTAENPFTQQGDAWAATLASSEPRWIHYSVCVTSSTMCSPTLVVASPTTTVAYATGKTKFVPDNFMAPPVPEVAGYTWNILEPEILKEDYAALTQVAGRSGPMKITSDEDYGELKRHRWEFQHLTSFAYGILSADGSHEIACVYVNPSKKEGYDAAVHFLMTEEAQKENLQPLLEKKVRDWISTSWPFAKVAYPGIDISMAQWNALPNAGE